MNVNSQVAALLIRLVVGLIFLIHGIAKFQGGIENTVGFFDKVGIPGFMAYLVAIIEVVGGIALLIGLGTRIFAGAFVLIMMVAIATVKIGKGFTGGYEFELALLSMALFLVIGGSSFLSLDRVLFRKKENTQMAQ